eukprot:TRINITY_DN18149_c0_g1_i1.p1 TRINITY_DN18149_c0_g1~~TRINITY_DN18149_c0_g1_i1.p1  ORF type:complete len:456 (-),score=81.79 TRINITY_DN18149_c0_g1_i1:48-1415(-)
MLWALWVIHFVSATDWPDSVTQRVGVLFPERQYPTLGIAQSIHAGLLFGGVSGSEWLRDTYILDMTTGLNVSKVSPVGTAPPYQGPGASAVWNDALGTFYLFGGKKRNTPTGSSFLDNTLWIFNHSAFSWAAVGCVGLCPSPREGHAAFDDEENKRMVIFGGKSENDTVLGDSWQFNYTTLQWSVLENGGSAIPTPRWGHVFGVWKNEVRMFGGVNTPGEMFNVTVKGNEIEWNQIRYGVISNTNYSYVDDYIPNWHTGIAFSITQIQMAVTSQSWILMESIETSNLTCFFIYNLSDSNWTSHCEATNNMDLSGTIFTGLVSPSGFYFYDGKYWIRYSVGVCSDSFVALHEECDNGSIDVLQDNCLACYIELCNNGQLDDSEDCDGGPMCTDQCTCPDPFMKEQPGGRNGCVPESVGYGYVLMIFYPVVFGCIFLGLLANYVRIYFRTGLGTKYI